MKEILLRPIVRRAILYAYDVFACAASMLIALLFRLNEFSDFGLYVIFSEYKLLILVSVFIKLTFFYIFKVSSGIWRFTSIPDLKAILKATFFAEALTVIIMFFAIRGEYIPRTAFIFDAMITIYLVAGARIFYRFIREKSGVMGGSISGKRAVILGAGNVAERLLRDIQKSNYDFTVVGLLDDEVQKQGRTILGLKVLSSIDKLDIVVKKFQIEKVIIAIPSFSSSQVRKIVQMIDDPKVEIVTVPSLKDIVEGKLTLSQMRKIDVNDLLGRDPVSMEVSLLAPLIKGQTVLVTGAGGSIGSELVKQLAKLGPSEIVLYDNNEFFLFELESELTNKFSYLKFHLVVGDVRDQVRLDQVLQEFKPHVCYHAAAYKHVPMMESNPHEAIKVNVFGTRNVLDACVKHNVKKFILVSTDKAVRPTNVMGATKKIAEMICSAYAKVQENLEVVIVRFGNVLASHGSVVPIFLEQIKQGGPVTVTHKEITRYFMSITEAAQLVLNAGGIGKSGQIMVLDMGEPVRIWDLAKQLVQLSGLKPDIDIEIKETGLRPGEKLYEELFYESEKVLDTSYSKIKVCKYHEISTSYLEELKIFEQKYLAMDSSRLRKALSLIISNEAGDIQKYLQ